MCRNDGWLFLSLQKWKLKKRRQQQGWWEKFQRKMAKTDGFPSEHIINIFLRPDSSNLAGVCLSSETTQHIENYSLDNIF
jgi:hypothetical protein